MRPAGAVGLYAVLFRTKYELDPIWLFYEFVHLARCRCEIVFLRGGSHIIIITQCHEIITVSRDFVYQCSLCYKTRAAVVGEYKTNDERTTIIIIGSVIAVVVRCRSSSRAWSIYVVQSNRFFGHCKYNINTIPRDALCRDNRMRAVSIWTCYNNIDFDRADKLQKVLERTWCRRGVVDGTRYTFRVPLEKCSRITLHVIPQYYPRYWLELDEMLRRYSLTGTHPIIIVIKILSCNAHLVGYPPRDRINYVLMRSTNHQDEQSTIFRCST